MRQAEEVGLSPISGSKSIEENRVQGSCLEERFMYRDQGQGSVKRMRYMGRQNALAHQEGLSAQNTGLNTGLSATRTQVVEDHLPPFRLDQVTEVEVNPVCTNKQPPAMEGEQIAEGGTQVGPDTIG